MSGPTERWYANHEGRDHVSVEVRFPNEVLVYAEPGLDSARWVWLRIGGVRFLLPVDQMRLLLEAAMEQLDDCKVVTAIDAMRPTETQEMP